VALRPLPKRNRSEAMRLSGVSKLRVQQRLMK
jgi:hypothetical protein